MTSAPGAPISKTWAPLELALRMRALFSRPASSGRVTAVQCTTRAPARAGGAADRGGGVDHAVVLQLLGERGHRGEVARDAALQLHREHGGAARVDEFGQFRHDEIPL